MKNVLNRQIESSTQSWVRDFWAPPFGRRRLGARTLGRRPFGRRPFGRRRSNIIIIVNSASGIELNNYWNISVD